MMAHIFNKLMKSCFRDSLEKILGTIVQPQPQSLSHAATPLEPDQPPRIGSNRFG